MGTSVAPVAQRFERTSSQSQSLPQTPSHVSTRSQSVAAAAEPVLAIADQPIQFELVDLEIDLPGIKAEALVSPPNASEATAPEAAASNTSASALAGASSGSVPAIVSAESARTAAILRGLCTPSGLSAPPPSDAPLVVTSEQPAIPSFVQQFVLRFVGCVQVGAERGASIRPLSVRFGHSIRTPARAARPFESLDSPGPSFFLLKYC